MSTAAVTPDIGGVVPGAGGAGTPDVGSTNTGGEQGGGGQGGGNTETGGSGGEGEKHGPIEYEIDGKKFKIEDENETPDEPKGEDKFKFKDLDAIKEQHAELHKSLMKRLSEHSRLTAKFKTPEELDSYVSRVERLANGGSIDQLETTVDHIATELMAWRNGDPSDYIKEHPEEFSAAAAKMDEAWAKADEKAWIANRAQAFMTALQAKDASGLSALSALLEAAKQTTDPKVKALLERTMYTIDAINQNSQYKPDSSKLAQRQLDQREATVFMAEVNQRNTPLVKSALRDALNKVAGDLKMTSEERASYMEDMEKSYVTAAKKNTRYMRELAAAKAAKNHNEIDALTKEYRAEFAHEAVKALYRSRLSKLKENIKKEAASKTEGGNTGSTQQKNAAKYTGQMNPNGTPAANFDFARMRDEGISFMDTRTFYVKGDNKLYFF